MSSTFFEKSKKLFAVGEWVVGEGGFYGFCRVAGLFRWFHFGGNVVYWRQNFYHGG